MTKHEGCAMHAGRETQSTPGSAIYQAGTPVVAPAPPRVGAVGMLARLLRLLVRRLLRLTFLIGGALRPYAAMLVVVAMALGTIGWLAWQLWMPAPGTAASFTRAESIAPIASVERYLDARRSFDADAMWDTFSTSFQTTQLNMGATKATLQAQADNERSMGVTYGRVSYIGGIPTQDGGTMYFYAVDITVQSQKLTVSLVFEADAQGKIENVSSPLNRLGSN